MTKSVCVFLAFSLVASPLVAQNVRPSPGERVRIQRAGESANRVYTLNDVIADTLVLASGSKGAPAETRMLLGSIARLQVSGGHRSFGARAWRGAAVGLGGGALAGGLIGFASGDDRAGFMSWSAEDKAFMLGFALGSVGLIAGTIAGVASNGEHWKSVPLDHITMSPTLEGGLALTYTYPF